MSQSTDNEHYARQEWEAQQVLRLKPYRNPIRKPTLTDEERKQRTDALIKDDADIFAAQSTEPNQTKLNAP